MRLPPWQHPFLHRVALSALDERRLRIEHLEPEAQVRVRYLVGGARTARCAHRQVLAHEAGSDQYVQGMVDTLADFAGDVGEAGPSAPDGRQDLGVAAGGREFLAEHAVGVFEQHATRRERKATQILECRFARFPLPKVQRISAARRIRLQQVLGRQIGKKLASCDQVHRRQRQRQRRPPAQGSSGAQNPLHHPHGGAGQNQHQPGPGPQVVPHHLHDAGEPGSRTRQIRNLVQYHEKGPLRGRGREELQRRLPGRERTTGQMCGLVTEILVDHLGKPPQLDRLSLLGGAEEHGSLASSKVREQERLADPPAPPHDEQLRIPLLGTLPSLIEPAEFRGPIYERCEHIVIVTPSPRILVTMLRSCNRS